MDQSTGQLVSKLVFPVANCSFTIRAYNDTGEAVTSVVMSAKGQIPPRGLTYAASMSTACEFAVPPNSTGLYLVGDAVSIKPFSALYMGVEYYTLRVSDLPVSF